MEAPKDIDVPTDLIAEEIIEQKLQQARPKWVPIYLDPSRTDCLEDVQKELDLAKQYEHMEIAESETENGHLESEEQRKKRKRGEKDSEVIPRLLHKDSKIILLELSNGIRVNYLSTPYSKDQCTIRLTRFVQSAQ